MSDHDKTSAPDHSSPPSAVPYTFDRTISEFESFECYPEEDTYRAFYDADQHPPSIAVVSAVAAVSDTDPTKMNPLHATIDTDALDALASPRRTTEGDLHVTFEFHGYEVTLSDYGCITIQPQPSTGPSAAAGD